VEFINTIKFYNLLKILIKIIISVQLGLITAKV